jgi:hypothetical protein
LGREERERRVERDCQGFFCIVVCAGRGGSSKPWQVYVCMVEIRMRALLRRGLLVVLRDAGGTNFACKVLVEFAMNVRAVVIHDVLVLFALSILLDPSAEAPWKAYAPHPP